MLALVILAAIILLAALGAIGLLVLVTFAPKWRGGNHPPARLPTITTPTPPTPIYAADGSLANADTIRAWYRKEFERR